MANTIQYRYKLVKKLTATRHYQLVPSNKQAPQLITSLLNISVNRGFAKSKPIYFSKERNGNKWHKTTLTGLFKTQKENMFYGDRAKKDLILFYFKNNEEDLIITYYKDQYKAKKPLINKL